jgi:hypothetical protein
MLEILHNLVVFADLLENTPVRCLKAVLRRTRQAAENNSGKYHNEKADWSGLSHKLSLSPFLGLQLPYLTSGLRESERLPTGRNSGPFSP